MFRSADKCWWELINVYRCWKINIYVRSWTFTNIHQHLWTLINTYQRLPTLINTYHSLSKFINIDQPLKIVAFLKQHKHEPETDKKTVFFVLGESFQNYQSIDLSNFNVHYTELRILELPTSCSKNGQQACQNCNITSDVVIFPRNSWWMVISGF